MGAACSAQKKKEKEGRRQNIQQNQPIQDQPRENKEQVDKDVDTQKRSNHKNKSVPPRHQQSIEENQEEQIDDKNEIIKKVLYQHKRFSMMIELFGDLDKLPPTTRDQINQLIILRSNINIIIQNNIKRILKQKQIVKRVEDEDQEYLWKDDKFGTVINQQTLKIANIIDLLEKDVEFESSFPILVVSLSEISTEFKELNLKFSKIQEPPKVDIKKQVSQKKVSTDSNFIQHRSTVQK